jgi:hypothetical protein
MSPNTRVLIDYWKRLPTRSAQERLTALEQLCSREQGGGLSRTALLPYVLADDDENVVHRATLACVAPGGVMRSIDRAAVADALEWIRRRLALNRGAVFAALLALDDEQVTASLAGLRLSLDAPEAATVFRRGARAGCARTRKFLEGWQELAGSPPTQPSGVLAAA